MQNTFRESLAEPLHCAAGRRILGRMGSLARIEPFTFHGDRLEVVRLPDGDVGVSVRRVAETLGLDPDAQLRRLDRAAADGLRWAVTVTMAATGPDGKTYQVRVLPRRSIPMWAATVDASRCSPNVRTKLVAYQDEAAEALAAHFLDGRGSAGSGLAPRVGALESILEKIGAHDALLVEHGDMLGRHTDKIAENEVDLRIALGVAIANESGLRTIKAAVQSLQGRTVANDVVALLEPEPAALPPPAAEKQVKPATVWEPVISFRLNDTDIARLEGLGKRHKLSASLALLDLVLRPMWAEKPGPITRKRWSKPPKYILPDHGKTVAVRLSPKEIACLDREVMRRGKGWNRTEVLRDMWRVWWERQ